MMLGAGPGLGEDERADAGETLPAISVYSPEETNVLSIQTLYEADMEPMNLLLQKLPL